MAAKINFFISFLIIICIPIVIFLTTLLFLKSNYGFYQKIYNQQDLYKNYENKEAADSKLLNIALFLKGKQNLDSSYFSKQAVLHMQDVRTLFSNLEKIQYFLEVSILISITSFFYRKNYHEILKSLKLGAALTIILNLAAALLITINFSYFFELTHYPIFPNSLWQFNVDDNLVKLFPLNFFIAFSQYLVVYTLTLSLLLLIIVFALKKYDRKSS